MASKIKQNDQVIVIAGKDKGKQGTVKRVVQTKKGKRIYIEGVNLIKKHVRPNPQANQPGGILEQEASLDISNVAIYNPISKKADRVGFKVVKDGAEERKVRVYRSNGEQVDA